MNLHTLKPAKGATKAAKRIGRGQGSGKGGTSTRGHKGAKSRSGWSRKRNFEGGQMPLQMRLPKRGFNSRNRVAYVAINLSNLSEIAVKYDLDNITLEVNIVPNFHASFYFRYDGFFWILQICFNQFAHCFYTTFKHWFIEK